MRQPWHMLVLRARSSRHASLFVLVSMVLSLFAPFAATPASAANYTLTAAVPAFSSSNIGAWQLNNSAALSGSVLRITPASGDKAGSAFFKNRASLANQRSFSSYFVLSFTGMGNNPGYAAGADGIVFTLQTNSNTAGGVGSGIGYEGITPSVGIEFDTFNNAQWGINDPNDHHVGLNVGGNINSVVTATTPAALKGNTWNVWVDYNGSTHGLQVRMSLGNNRATSSLVLDTTYDIASQIGSDVYVGFTAATGGAWENHDVQKFYFNNDYLSGGIDPLVNTYAQAPTSVTLGASPSSIGNDNIQTTTLTATVRGPDNSLMPNQEISFITAGGVLSNSSATTDANGQASVTLRSAVVGTTTVRASAVGGYYGETTVTVTDVTPPSPPTVVAPVPAAILNKTTPVFSGTASSDTASVHVAESNVELCSATPAPDHTWTCTATFVQAQGAHTVAVTARDAAANTSGATSRSFTVDTINPSAPAILAPTAGQRIGDTTPDFSGTAEPNSIVKVVDDETLLCLDAADGAGAWSCTSSSLSNATYTVSATATDDAGNESVPSSRTFTVDTVAPAAPHVARPADGAVLNVARPTFEGTAEADSALEVRNAADDALLCAVTVDPSGDWSCPLTADLADAAYTVDVTAADIAGNRSLATSLALEVDTLAPDAPSIDAPAAGVTLATAEPTFDGTAENGTLLEVRQAGTLTLLCSTTVVDGDWSCSSKLALADGPNAVVVTARDAAANESQSTARAFTVDTTAPDAPVVQAPLEDALINDATPTISGTAEIGSLVTVLHGVDELCSATADANGDWSCTPSGALAEGAATLSVVARDAVLNSSSSATLHITVDTLTPAAATNVVPADGAVTNDTTPSFSGSAEADAAITVSWNGTPLCTTTVAQNGTWSCTAQDELPAGDRTVVVRVADAAGNYAETTLGLVIDVTAPSVPELATPGDGASLNDATPEFTGTAEIGSTVVVMHGATELCRTVAGPLGAWSCTATSSLADGPATITITVTDPAGNVGSAASLTLTIDTGVPVAPGTAGGLDGSVLSDTTPELTGTAELGSTVVVLDGTTEVCRALVDANGSWSCTPSSVLAQGAHTLSIEVRDVAGNASAPLTVTLTIDSVQPNAPQVGGPTDGSATNDTTPEFTGSAEAGSLVEVLDGATVLCSVVVEPNGSWLCSPVSPLSGGAYSVVVRVTDAAGNQSTSEPVALTVDTVVPAAPADVLPADATATNDATPEFTGTAEPGSTIVVMDGATVLCTATVDVNGNWSCSPATALSEGSHSVAILVTDAAGNASPPLTLTLTVDITLPVAPVPGGPHDGTVTNDATPEFGGTAEPGSKIEVREGATVVCTATADANGDWSCSPAAALLNGSHAVLILVTDAAGNASPPAEVTVQVDTDAPDAPRVIRPLNGSATADATPEFAGTAEPGSVVVVTEAAVAGCGVAAPHGGSQVCFQGSAVGTLSSALELCRTTVDSSGTWNCTPTTALASGTRVLKVTVTDAGGSTSGETSLQITVDGDNLAPPTISTLVRPNHGSPIVEGTHLPGTAITLIVDPDGDPTTDDLVVFVTTADANGHWSVNLGTATPVVGAMPAGGIDASTSFGLTAVGADQQGRVSPLVRQLVQLLHQWWLPFLRS